MAKTILVTGGAGYIGSVLCGVLLDAGYSVVCADRFFFGEDTVDAYRANPRFRTAFCDTRHMTRGDDSDLFKGVSAVIDLAGLSNDPTCDIDEKITEDINYRGAVVVAEHAKRAGVPRYIYSSSCSVYGHAVELPVKETSPCRPVSLYAKCKLRIEQALTEMADDNFCVVFPRFATAYGLSPRMRLDLIINHMAAYGFTQRKITVLGGGRQWRPVVHLKDICAALGLLLEAPAGRVNREVFNIGSNAQNYRVLEIAYHIQDLIPGLSVNMAPDDPDRRSYNVDFTKFATTFGFTPSYDIIKGAKEIIGAVRNCTIDMSDRRTSTRIYYSYLIEADRILNGLRFNGQLL